MCVNKYLFTLLVKIANGILEPYKSLSLVLKSKRSILYCYDQDAKCSNNYILHRALKMFMSYYEYVTFCFCYCDFYGQRRYGRCDKNIPFSFSSDRLLIGVWAPTEFFDNPLQLLQIK